MSEGCYRRKGIDTQTSVPGTTSHNLGICTDRWRQGSDTREVSFAHYGVLFLDELPEFSKPVLEVLRQPLEDRRIRISRVQASYEFPADFMFVAAMNPCPCGNYPDYRRCSCTEQQIRRYQSKVSGPLLDRIDIRMEVKGVKQKVLFSKQKTESSKTIRTGGTGKTDAEGTVCRNRTAV